MTRTDTLNTYRVLGGSGRTVLGNATLADAEAYAALHEAFTIELENGTETYLVTERDHAGTRLADFKVERIYRDGLVVSETVRDEHGIAVAPLKARELIAGIPGDDAVEETPAMVEQDIRRMRASGWILACSGCELRFDDGIEAGNHEVESGHRVSWAAPDAGDETSAVDTYIAELEARREERDEVGDARESTELSYRIRMLREGTPLDIDVRALALGDRRIPIRPATVERELVAELEEDRARFYVTVVSVGDAGLTARPAVIDREYGRTVKVFRSNERSLADTMARTLNADDAKAKAGPRDKVAELEVLERFDALRRHAGHDYGAGQRRTEIIRRERELDPRYRLHVSDDVIEPTAGELLAAFHRIAATRRDRIIRREDFRRSTPATQRTLRTWDRLENALTIESGLEAKREEVTAGA